MTRDERDELRALRKLAERITKDVEFSFVEVRIAKCSALPFSQRAQLEEDMEIFLCEAAHAVPALLDRIDELEAKP